MTRALLAVAALSLAAASFTPTSLIAQQRETRVYRLPVPGGEVIWAGAANRAVLGVTLGAGSPADTAGITLEAVDANGPAAKAGLKAGDIITAINGVSLKVAREDAEDLALTGLAQRRLQRVLAKAKPGDEVSLQLRSGSASRTVSIKTVSAADLEQGGERRVMSRERRPDSTSARRGMVGVSIGAAGNLRDTLGLFVSSVVSGGPADKAGIVEGERIAAVNGVDVRIPREDIEDPQAASARADRFVREVQKVAPGQSVTFRVYGNGRYREVSVTAVRAADLPSTGFGVDIGDREIRIMTPPRPPRASWTPTPPGAPGSPESPRIRVFQRDGGAIEFDGQRLRESLEEMRRTLRAFPRDGGVLEIDGQHMRESLDELGRNLRGNFRGLELERRDGGLVRTPVRRTISA